MLSGRLMPELLQPATPLGGRCAPVDQLSAVPLLVTHGSDDATTPAALGQESARSFEQWRGAPLDFRLLQGDGHEISGQCQKAVRSFLHEHLS